MHHLPTFLVVAFSILSSQVFAADTRPPPGGDKADTVLIGGKIVTLGRLPRHRRG